VSVEFWLRFKICSSLTVGSSDLYFDSNMSMRYREIVANTELCTRDYDSILTDSLNGGGICALLGPSFVDHSHKVRPGMLVIASPLLERLLMVLNSRG
jgi:hypothetical protein